MSNLMYYTPHPMLYRW